MRTTQGAEERVLPGPLVGGESAAEGMDWKVRGQGWGAAGAESWGPAGGWAEAVSAGGAAPSVRPESREGHGVILYCGARALGVSQILDFIFF